MTSNRARSTRPKRRDADRGDRLAEAALEHVAGPAGRELDCVGAVPQQQHARRLQRRRRRCCRARRPRSTNALSMGTTSAPCAATIAPSVAARSRRVVRHAHERRARRVLPAAQRERQVGRADLEPLPQARRRRPRPCRCPTAAGSRPSPAGSAGPAVAGSAANGTGVAPPAIAVADAIDLDVERPAAGSTAVMS